MTSGHGGRLKDDFSGVGWGDEALFPRAAMVRAGPHPILLTLSTLSLIGSRLGIMYKVTVEYFEKGGHAGLYFRYMGPDTENKMLYVGDDKHRKASLAVLS